MKIGRNDPCPCGSGKKYKQCCASNPDGAPSSPASQASIADMLQAAVEHHQAARLPLAESLYRQVLQADPRHADALYFSGVLARQAGDMGSAVDFFRRTLQVKPAHGAALVSLGNVQQAMGELEAATGSYTHALQINPAHVEAHANLGNVMQAQGLLDEAVQSYRKALAIKPDFAEIHGNLGNVLQAQGSFDESVASYRQALAILPGSAELLSNLGVSLQAQGNVEGAIEYFRKALIIKPDYAAAHYNLGLALQAQGLIDETVQSYREAIRLMPGNAQIHASLASALQAQKHPGMAVDSYRQALAIDPSLVAAHHGMTALLSTMVPLWHVPMMNDAVRNDAYFQALKAAITPASHVLEIGTGSGLLAMMAAKLGARAVTTCEAEALIAATAERVIADNGLQQRIRVIAKMSGDVTIGGEMAEPADILVSEILSSELLGERVLPSIEDAKRRLLKPGGQLIPAAGSIMIALFGGEEIGSNVIVEESCGFNLRRFNSIVQRKQGITRNDLNIEMLSADVAAFSFDFQNDAFHPGQRKLLRIPVTAAGRCYGIIQWIRLQMDAHTVFENHPGVKAAASGWQHLAYIFPEPVELKAGQIAVVSAVHNRIFPWFAFEGIE